MDNKRTLNFSYQEEDNICFFILSPNINTFLNVKQQTHTKQVPNKIVFYLECRYILFSKIVNKL